MDSNSGPGNSGGNSPSLGSPSGYGSTIWGSPGPTTPGNEGAPLKGSQIPDVGAEIRRYENYLGKIGKGISSYEKNTPITRSISRDLYKAMEVVDKETSHDDFDKKDIGLENLKHGKDLLLNHIKQYHGLTDSRIDR